MRYFFRRTLGGVFCAVLFASGTGLGEDRHGLTREVQGTSAFVFRWGELRHEVTRLGSHWVEAFYEGGQAVIVRAGVFDEGRPVVTSERFPSGRSVAVFQVSGQTGPHPVQMTVGTEVYRRTEEGFFEILPDAKDVLKESVLLGTEFSTRELEQLRAELLARRVP
jgi:hypothetical protein